MEPTAASEDRFVRFCDEFIDHPTDPHGGTYCKLLAGHDGPHSAHYRSRAAPPAEITVYVCPVCGTWDESEHYTGGHDFDRFPECHRNQRVPVRYVVASSEERHGDG
jgi:hypothetical protein